MFSLHDKGTMNRDGLPQAESWRPNVPERQVDLGRTWYGRKRKPEVRKARPHGGYDRYAGYDAPTEQEIVQRQRVDFSMAAFVLGAAALVLAWWPILKYIGVGFALLAALVGTKELHRHSAAARVRLRGEGEVPPRAPHRDAARVPRRGPTVRGSGERPGYRRPATAGNLSAARGLQISSLSAIAPSIRKSDDYQ